MAHDVFISYSHIDKVVADAICSALESRGVRCWYAPRDIAPGEKWAGAIVNAISSSKIMVLVFTDFSNVSRQVLREVDNAVSEGVVIMPFRLTESEPTDEMRYYLATVHWLDALSEPLMEAIDSLCANVTAILQPAPAAAPSAGPAAAPSVSAPDPPVAPVASAPVSPSAEPAPQAAVTPPRPPQRKTGLIAAAGAAVLVLAVGAAVFAARPKPSGAPPVSSESMAVSEEPSVPEPSAEVAEKPDSGAANAPAEPKTAADGQADPAQAENFLYTVKGETVLLDAYFGENETVVTVPEQIEGKPVTWIGLKCFEGQTSIEQVILPDTIEKIDYRAFEGCRKLKTINLPASLRVIGAWSFAHTGFDEMIIPEGVGVLGDGAFYDCIHLNSVSLPAGIDKIGEDTFRGCTVLRRVVIPNPDISIDPKGFDKGSSITIAAVKGSTAETYCRAMSLTFEEYQP